MLLLYLTIKDNIYFMIKKLQKKIFQRQILFIILNKIFKSTKMKVFKNFILFINHNIIFK